MHFMQMLRLFTKFTELTLIQRIANVFDPQHLKGSSTELVQSMFKIGRKVAELERQKLQMEIRKEESEIRRKKLGKTCPDGIKKRQKGWLYEKPEERI